MAKTGQQAYDDILAHIKKQGGGYSAWYVGITSKIDIRLYGNHKVPRENHWFAYRTCVNNESARAVEKVLLALGCDGGGSGRDEDSVIVYAYLKTSFTKP
jgi:hypothetical protein